MSRPAIPRPLEREVLLEAGHRCAIPTCRQTPVEIAHITPWEQVKEHAFENLIALCPTCHARYDRKEIDRQSMYRYKANLAILNGRYGDLEKRVLQYFADKPNENEIVLFGGLEVLLSYLMKDGLIKDTGKTGGVGFGGDYGTIWTEKPYELTDNGRAFIKKWVAAEELK